MSDSIALLFSAVLAASLVQTLRLVHRTRATLFDDDVTLFDRATLDRAAFLVLVPPGVLLHELGHALATWQAGGRVVDWGWYLFYGYVLPAGNFTPLQDWWISLAGNLVSVVIGLAAAMLLVLPLRPPWFYLTLAFARVQILYALIGYPLLSLGSQWGDWVTIYSRQGGNWTLVTAVVHASLLAAMWGIGRSARYAAWVERRVRGDAG